MIDDNLYTRCIWCAGSLEYCVRNCAHKCIAAAKLYHQNSNKPCVTLAILYDRVPPKKELMQKFIYLLWK